MDKPKLLCIDDEERILRTLKAFFRHTHKVYITTCFEEFENILRNEDIDVVVSDQRIPQKSGAECLALAKSIAPNATRIMLTGYSDNSDIMDSINEAEVYRYVTKPWDNDNLRSIVNSATSIALKTKNLPKIKNVSYVHDGFESKSVPVLYANVNNIESHSFIEKLGSEYDITFVENEEQLEERVSIQEFDVAIIDMDFPGQEITNLIQRLKNKQPLLVTILISEFTDNALLIDLINAKQVFRCCEKPINFATLKSNIDLAIDRFNFIKRDPELQLRYLLETPNVINSDDS